MTHRYKVGDAVEKTKGHPFPGVVVAVGRTSAGHVRYMVESTVLKGMLYILSAKVLRKASKNRRRVGS